MDKISKKSEFYKLVEEKFLTIMYSFEQVEN
jgi:hypothetical protein